MCKDIKVILALAFLWSIVPSFGQKIKYKDLFPLLDAKRYDEAEPFLKKYLVQDPEYANANFQMGLLLDHKTRHSDIFKDKDLIQQYADSSIIFYNKFTTLLDEKEIKKRDEYYQEYNRRDLRTGKFEIKEQDIRFDIDNKIKELTTYKDKVGEINKHMSDAIRQYHTAKSSFIYLSRSEKTMEEFLLASNQVTEESLEYMSSSYDSAMTSIKEIQDLMEEIENDSYLQSVGSQAINDYKEDGYSEIDFYQEEFSMWDYKSWAESINTTIRDEIKPLKEKILAYSEGLNKLFINTAPDLATLNSLSEIDFEQDLLKYDKEPLPLHVFRYKKMEILYKIENNPSTNDLLADTSNIDYMIMAQSNNLEILGKVDSLVNAFKGKDALKHEAKIHSAYVAQDFNDLESLENFISYKKDWVTQEKEAVQLKLDSLTEYAKYAYLPADTLSLEVNGDSTVSFSTQAIEELGSMTLSSVHYDSLGYFLSGVKLTGDSSTFFATKVLPSRKSEWVFQEPLASILDPEMGETTTMAFQNQVLTNLDCWILISMKGDAKEKGLLYRVNNAGEKLWGVPLELPSAMTDFKVDSLSMETLIQLDDGSTLTFDAEGSAK